MSRTSGDHVAASAGSDRTAPVRESASPVSQSIGQSDQHLFGSGQFKDAQKTVNSVFDGGNPVTLADNSKTKQPKTSPTENTKPPDKTKPTPDGKGAQEPPPHEYTEEEIVKALTTMPKKSQ